MFGRHLTDSILGWSVSSVEEFSGWFLGGFLSLNGEEDEFFGSVLVWVA